MMDAETKGDRAAQILETEVYQEAIVGAKARIADEWAQAEDPEKRDDLWHKLKAIDAVTTELKIIRDRGIKARNERDKKEKVERA
jgi:hypothetical protein